MHSPELGFGTVVLEIAWSKIIWGTLFLSIPVLQHAMLNVECQNGPNLCDTNIFSVENWVKVGYYTVGYKVENYTY